MAFNKKPEEKHDAPKPAPKPAYYEQHQHTIAEKAAEATEKKPPEKKPDEGPKLRLALTRVFESGIKRVNVWIDDDGNWASDDPEFSSRLQGTELDPGQYYPDREKAKLELIQSWYGGEITDTRAKQESSPDEVQ